MRKIAFLFCCVLLFSLQGKTQEDEPKGHRSIRGTWFVKEVKTFEIYNGKIKDTILKRNFNDSTFFNLYLDFDNTPVYTILLRNRCDNGSDEFEFKRTTQNIFAEKTCDCITLNFINRHPYNLEFTITHSYIGRKDGVLKTIDRYKCSRNP